MGNLEGLRRLVSDDNDGFGGFFQRYGDPSKAHRALVDAAINKADEAPTLWRSWAMSEQSQVVAKGVSEPVVAFRPTWGILVHTGPW